MICHPSSMDELIELPIKLSIELGGKWIVLGRGSKQEIKDDK